MNQLWYDDGSRKYITLGEYLKEKARKIQDAVLHDPRQSFGTDKRVRPKDNLEG